MNCATKYTTSKLMLPLVRIVAREELFTCNELNRHFATAVIGELRLSNQLAAVYLSLLYFRDE